MSTTTTNTIKLSSAEGDKYIGAQQTLVYKGVTLFGYGYLDWGNVVNQSIINLMDSIDNLSTNGLSQIQFDLTEYEETQKKLRAEEFASWKTGFKGILTDLVQSYIDESRKMITDFETGQNTINEEVSKLIKSNFTTLDGEIKDISSNLNEKILIVVQEQISTVSNSLDTLTSKVNQAYTNLQDATSNVNKVLTEAQTLISNFKNEFGTSFDTFKKETNDALTSNKDAIIKYVDTLIGKTNSTTTNIDERVTALELVSDSLNPDTIRTIIISKVNELAGGIVASALGNYETRLHTLETEIGDINNNLPNVIKEKVDAATTSINTQINAMNKSIISFNKTVQDLNNAVTPIDNMRVDIVSKFGTTENMTEQILDQALAKSELFISAGSLSKEHKNALVNVIQNLITQEVRNNENMVAYINSQILNLLDGMGLTAFNELALIGRTSAKDNLFNNLTNQIHTNINDYNVNELKFIFMETDYTQNTISFAFKLPTNLVHLWNTYGIVFTNTTTNEVIESEFQAIGNAITLQHPTLIGAEPITDIVPLNQVNAFRYNVDWNASSFITIKFASLAKTHNFNIKVYDSGAYVNKLIEGNVLLSDTSYIDADDHYKNVIYPNLYMVNETISKPTPITQNITWTNTNDRVLVPVCQIQTKPDGSKIIALKVKLPNNATLTNIVLNDGVSSSTKVFTNQSTFPLTELEYASRNLIASNNYYKDICSTGLIYFTIDSTAKKVTGTITYVLGGVTKTYDISTSSSSGGSETHIQDSTIGSGAYVDYSMATLFGAGTDANNIMVEVRVLETNTTSEVYNKYLKADHLTSVVWMDADKIRIYNEYNTSLTFRTIFKS